MTTKNLKMDTVTFEDAINECKGKTKHLLLGNGYSICYDDRYNYQNIYDKAFSDSNNINLNEIFNIIKSTNFEEVMDFLGKQIEIINIYDQKSKIKDRLKTDIGNIQSTLINTIVELSESYIHEINQNTSENILNYFDHQTSHIYTLNYDLILYARFLKYNEDHINAYKDGFSKEFNVKNLNLETRIQHPRKINNM